MRSPTITDIRHIIASPVDSDHDILKIATVMGVEIDQIVFKQFLNRKKNYSVLDMGTPELGGTHWIAVSNKDKIYFDPLGLPRPLVIPRDYKAANVRVQDYRYGHCADYVVLWLYYLQHDRLEDFYKLFTIYHTLTGSV
jgi:hypothetical protein